MKIRKLKSKQVLSLYLLKSKTYDSFISKKKQLLAFGFNSCTQLGLGDATNRLSPTDNTFFKDKTCSIISLGYEHSLFYDCKILFLFLFCKI